MIRGSFLPGLILAVALTDGSPCSAQFDVKLKANVAPSPPVELDRDREEEWFGRSAFSPDGHYFLLAKREGQFTLWDTQSEKAVANIDTPYVEIERVHWSKTSRVYALVGRYDVKLSWVTTIWDAKTRKQLAILRQTNRPVDVAFSPDDLTLAVITERDERQQKGYVTLWELATSKERANLAFPAHFAEQGATFRPERIEYSPNGKTLLVFGIKSGAATVAAGQFYFWNTVTEEGRYTPAKNADKQTAFSSVGSYAFIPKTDILLVGGLRPGGGVGNYAVDVEAGTNITDEKLPPTQISQRWILDRTSHITGEHSRLTIYDLTDPRFVIATARSIDGVQVHTIGISSDGKRLTVLTREGKFQTWELSRRPPKDK